MWIVCTNIYNPRPGRCVVSLSKRHLLPKRTGNPRNRWLRLNMTEKMFTGTLNKNKKKKTKIYNTNKPLSAGARLPFKVSLARLPYINSLNFQIKGYGFVWSSSYLNLAHSATERLARSRKTLLYEPRCEKTALMGFRPGLTQTRL